MANSTSQIRMHFWVFLEFATSQRLVCVVKREFFSSVTTTMDAVHPMA